MAESYPKPVENTVGKGEITCYEQFLLFPQCFQKACFPGASKGVIVWEWVNTLLLIMYFSTTETLICRREMSLIASISFGFALNTIHDFQKKKTRIELIVALSSTNAKKKVCTTKVFTIPYQNDRFRDSIFMAILEGL